MANAVNAVTNLDVITRQEIRIAVRHAVEYWPNSHLGTNAPRQDIRSAFKMLRSHATHHGFIHAGIGAVERSAYDHMDM